LIIDLRHFLDESGELPEDLPTPATKLALFTGAIVSWVTGREPAGHERTNVWCRRSPGRRQCRGEIVAGFEDGGKVSWLCPVCGENGVVSGWERTRWDRRKT
jgi:hypothetical protein